MASLALACMGPSSTDNAEMAAATSVPVGQVTPGVGPAGGNGTTDPAPAPAGSGNTVTSVSTSTGAMSIASAVQRNLCLTAVTPLPTAGSQVTLATCGMLPAQRWWYDNGRLRTDPNLCLTNVAINQNAGLATATGLLTGNWVFATLTPCDPNDIRQHVEPFFGYLAGIAGPGNWALEAVRAPTVGSQMAWVLQRPSDVSARFALGADTYGDGPATSANTIAAANANALAAGNANMVAAAGTMPFDPAQLQAGGFAITVAGAPTLCLDSNAGAFALAVSPCAPAAAAASQRWRFNDSGALTQAGKCLDVNSSTVAMVPCVTPAPETQQFQANYGKILTNNGGCLLAPATTGAVVGGPCPQAKQFVWGVRPSVTP